jgi:hypothetical protein
MMTLRRFSDEIKAIPTVTVWYLTALSEALGKQELFTRQSPQKLKALRENALIESAISSNRIEGVTVDRSRIGTVIFGKRALHDRAEMDSSFASEIEGVWRGYRPWQRPCGPVAFSPDRTSRIIIRRSSIS